MHGPSPHLKLWRGPSPQGLRPWWEGLCGIVLRSGSLSPNGLVCYTGHHELTYIVDWLRCCSETSQLNFIEDLYNICNKISLSSDASQTTAVSTNILILFTSDPMLEPTPAQVSEGVSRSTESAVSIKNQNIVITVSAVIVASVIVLAVVLGCKSRKHCRGK